MNDYELDTLYSAVDWWLRDGRYLRAVEMARYSDPNDAGVYVDREVCVEQIGAPVWVFMARTILGEAGRDNFDESPAGSGK